MPRRRSERLAGAFVGLGLLVWVSGCTSGPLTRDQGFRLQRPVEGSIHGLPLRMEWSPTGGADAYAVYLDQTPPPAGQRVEEASGVFLVQGTQFELDRLPGTGSGAVREHQLVVVPVSAGGTRVGEDALTASVTINPRALEPPS